MRNLTTFVFFSAAGARRCGVDRSIHAHMAFYLERLSRFCVLACCYFATIPHMYVYMD